MKEFVDIYAYKHDSSFHRIWTRSEMLAETKDYYITYTPKNVRVIECKQSFWRTKEPAVCYFSKKRWFNIIVVFREDEVMYYCNLASPILKELKSLKYIDYDLDIKVLDDYSYTVLDRNEYNKHMERMQYPSELKQILEKELIVLRQMIETRQDPFNEKVVLDWYDKYTKLNKFF